MNSKKYYWLCQLAGWGGMVAVETINYTFFIVGKFNFNLLKTLLFDAFTGLLITHIFKIVISKTSFFKKSETSIWLIALLSTFLLAVCINIVGFIPYLFQKNWLNLFKSLTPIYFFGLLMNWMRYAGVWVIIFFMYNIVQQNNLIIKEKLELENLSKTTELELLKAQLNPHFLFNALNSIKALVIINPEVSRDAIVKLSELLRLTLQYGKEKLIPIHDEIDEVKKYLELEQLRFEKRLSVQYNISEDTLSQTIPPAMILTLAENAVKHGVSKLPENSIIVIKTKLEDDFMIVNVINYGIYKPSESNGIGLKQITKRLDEVYHYKAIFSLSQQEKNVVASIKIPLL